MLTTTSNALVRSLAAAPRRPDGSAYGWEMVMSHGRTRVYADTVGELLDALIPGHGRLPDAEARRARDRHAHAVRPYLQSELATGHDLNGLSATERAAVDAGVGVTWWEQDFPLVLVDTNYAPVGPQPRPLTPEGDLQDPSTILWLRPDTAEGYLLSLARAGWVSLHQHKSVTVR